LPEERGLYKDVSVLDGVAYLATLKGLGWRDARARAREGLRRLDLEKVADKPLKALSRGMAQKAQFLATVLHEPELLIIDEPFSGLDPVNSRVLRDMLVDLRERGTTIVMSAHQMHRVEELCARLLVLVRGRAVLYGSLSEIRALFGSDSVYVEANGDLGVLPGVERVVPRGSLLELELARGTTPNDLMIELARRPELGVTRFEVHAPSLEDIFLIVASRPPATRAPSAMD
jgi:ABC-2 type transport system ATP-binding protein